MITFPHVWASSPSIAVDAKKSGVVDMAHIVSPNKQRWVRECLRPLVYSPVNQVQLISVACSSKYVVSPLRQNIM